MTDLAQDRLRLAVAAVMAAAALLWWATAGFFGHELIAQVAIFAIFAMSLDLLVGTAGMVSLGHAAFFGAGAYATAGLTVLLGWPAWLALPASMVVAGLLAVVVGAFAVRLAGVFFIMITLAIGEMVHAYLFRSRTFGGDDGLGGIPRPDLGALGLTLDDPSHFSLAVLTLALLVYLGLRQVVGSPFGQVLAGIHRNEARMRALGCPVRHYKLAAFTLAGAIAGLAGSLAAQHNNFISPELVTWTTSGEALIVVIVGGMGTLVGPVAGAAAVILAGHYLSGLTEYWMFFMGLMFVAVVLIAGDGLQGALERLARRFGRAAG
ncbi:MAG: branched-chain amino acid ABC transporter permease [Alphaproteobacteria bacterium]|nr:branched-chain amino acid ABC transporter permease [Alphaproteobacteria bacterium]